MKKPSLLPFINALSICLLSVSIAAFYYWDLTRFPPLPPPPSPPLLAEPAVIDFGDIQEKDVVQGNVIQGRATIKNTTDKPIRILHAIISCTCNNVRLRQGELFPGETTELSVDWDLRGRTGVTTASLVIVYVLDNDIQQFLSVGLKANIVSTASAGDC